MNKLLLGVLLGGMTAGVSALGCSGDDGAGGDDEPAGASSGAAVGSSGAPSSSGGSSSSSSGTALNEVELYEDSHIRVVGFWTRSVGDKPSLDIRLGPVDAARDASQPVASAAYGDASAYFTPSHDGFSVYDASKPGTDGRVSAALTRREFKPGERSTIVLSYAGLSGGGQPLLNTYELYESGPTDGSTQGFNSLPGRALIAVTAVSLLELADRGVDDVGYFFGVDGSGCILGDESLPSGPDNPPIFLGGTEAEFLDLAPGAHTINLYTDDACTVASAVPPIAVDVTADSRTYVVVGGTGPTDLQALVLPVTESP